MGSPTSACLRRKNSTISRASGMWKSKEPRREQPDLQVCTRRPSSVNCFEDLRYSGTFLLGEWLEEERYSLWLLCRMFTSCGRPGPGGPFLDANLLSSG